MDCHVDLILIADRHDLLQKILEIRKQLLIVHIPVLHKQFFDMCHSLWLPARHHSAVRIPCNRRKHLLRVQRIDRLLCVGKYCGTIRAHPRKLRSRPVKHRHKIITYEMNIFFSQILKRLNIVGDILLPFRRACLDRFVYVHALDSRNVQPRRLHFLLQRANALPAPHLARRRVIQRCNHARHARNLANLF